MTLGSDKHELPHTSICKETEKLRGNEESNFQLSVLGLPDRVEYAGVVACVKLFPRALMKRTQLIDGEREGSGN